MEYTAEDFDVSGTNLAQMSAGDMESARRVYGMVSNIDDNLGRLWKSISGLGIEENTLVVFMTDNGPQQRRYTAGFNGRKGSVLEGGIRVPCFFYWKGRLDEGRVVSYPSAHIDMMPTLLDVAGIQLPDNLDGVSLLPLLNNEVQELEERPLYFVWARGYPQKYTNMAVRKGPYKLAGFIGHGEPADSLKLFNIEEDPFEQHNVIRQHPEVFEELKKDLDSWYEEIIMSPNLITPPRIIIGSPYENPVILDRNDWKGPMATNWNSSSAFGYWDVKVEYPGPYEVRLIYEEPQGKGNAVIRVGTRQYRFANNTSGQKEIIIPDIRLNYGDQMLEAWYESRGEMYTPICIEILH